jgi:oligopeptide/dipeptide ABC transporter ATP-binding protein
MNNELIVDIKNLTIQFETIDGILEVIGDINIQIREGEIVGVVGETGCGKSVTAKLLLGILPSPPARIKRGEIFFLGQDLFRIDAAKRELLKQKIAYIAQDPMMSVNPVFTIGTLMVDMIIWRESHQKFTTYLWKRRNRNLVKKAMDYSASLLDKVNIPNPRSLLRKYSIELSGGMRQRVLLAMALIGHPRLLIADEPTTALDATIQKRILSLLEERVREENLSGMYITHNLGVARIICQRTNVRYAGYIVENGPTGELLDNPYHPYTQGLIGSIPRITGERFSGIDGQIPDYLKPPTGCRFHPRCPKKMDGCEREVPEFVEVTSGRFVACRLYQL